MLKFLPKLSCFGVLLRGKIWPMLKKSWETKVSLATQPLLLPKHITGGNGLALLSFYVSEECFPCGKADRML